MKIKDDNSIPLWVAIPMLILILGLLSYAYQKNDSLCKTVDPTAVAVRPSRYSRDICLGEDGKFFPMPSE